MQLTPISSDYASHGSSVYSNCVTANNLLRSDYFKFVITVITWARTILCKAEDIGDSCCGCIQLRERIILCCREVIRQAQKASPTNLDNSKKLKIIHTLDHANVLLTGMTRRAITAL